MLVIDPPSLYSSTKVLFWLTVLGTYGAVEAVLKAIKFAPRVWRYGLARWHNRSTETDYYYSYRESGYRVMLPDGHYWHVRRERVVAMGKLYDMGLSYSWSGEGTTEESIAPDSFSVTNLPSIPGHKLSRRRITFNPPLEQGQSAEYTFIVRCKQTGQPPAPFLSTRSSHRVDVLVLRVVFAPGIEPKKVDYVKRNTQLEEVTRERLPHKDFLTGEYRKQIDYPEPHIYHRIEWEV